jgi:hypothetical protein
LKDDLHAPPQLAQSGSIEGENIHALVQRLPAGGFLEPQDRPSDR